VENLVTKSGRGHRAGQIDPGDPDLFSDLNAVFSGPTRSNFKYVACFAHGGIARAGVFTGRHLLLEVHNGRSSDSQMMSRETRQLFIQRKSLFGKTNSIPSSQFNFLEHVSMSLPLEAISRRKA
jgi:hypothetical protein